MILFWSITVGMIAVALLMVAPSLLRKGRVAVSDQNRQNVAIARERLEELEEDHAHGILSQEEFDQAEEEVEQLLLLDLETQEPTSKAVESDFRHGPVTLAVLGVALPLISLLLYLLLGSPQMLERSAHQTSAAEGADQSGMPHSVDEMIVKLKERLKKNPQSPDGWYLLGRSYMATRQYPQAVSAFEKLHELVGDEPDALLALADAVAMTQGGGLKGRPADLIKKAVKLDPENPTGLWLAGMVAEADGDLDGALRYWRRLEPLVKDDPETQKQLQDMISQVEKQQASTTARPAK
jgi:cytochrome c-type biogenesis protein CcmH